jgi:hypothetical protein
MTYLKLLFELVTMPFVLVIGSVVYPLLYCADKWVAFLDICFMEPVKTVQVKTKKKVKVKKVK